MRWVVRSLLLWAICLPLFYLYGLPYLMATLQTKARAESYTQCQVHFQKEGIAGMLTPAEAEQYCHCVSDAIALEPSDLTDLVQKKQPERLARTMKPRVDACNTTLKEAITAAATAVPKRVETLPDGTEIVHFN